MSCLRLCEVDDDDNDVDGDVDAAGDADFDVAGDQAVGVDVAVDDVFDDDKEAVGDMGISTINSNVSNSVIKTSIIFF